MHRSLLIDSRIPSQDDPVTASDQGQKSRSPLIGVRSTFEIKIGNALQDDKLCALSGSCRAKVGLAS